MKRLLILYIILLLAYSESKSQSHFKPINVDTASTESEKIPFALRSVTLKTDNKFDLGKVAALKDETIYPLEMDSKIETSLIKFLNQRFSSVQAQPIVDIEIKTMRIAGAKPNSFSPTDTFLFECNFISDEDVLYQFKARNSFGIFNEPDKIMSKYIVRALVAAVKQFTKSYNKNPDWNKGNSNPLFNVKSKVIHNKIKDDDTIACEFNQLLKPEYFKGKLPNDSLTNEVISKLILTYKAESEETSKGIELTIHTKAIFDKNRSWKKNQLSNPNWLVYQQGHYDICAIYGLKLKEKMSTYSYSVGEFKSELNKLYNLVYAEYVSVRKQFSDETEQGRNSLKMEEWKIKIENMYKSTIK